MNATTIATIILLLACNVGTSGATWDLVVPATVAGDNTTITALPALHMNTADAPKLAQIHLRFNLTSGLLGDDYCGDLFYCQGSSTCCAVAASWACCPAGYSCIGGGQCQNSNVGGTGMSTGTIVIIIVALCVGSCVLKYLKSHLFGRSDRSGDYHRVNN